MCMRKIPVGLDRSPKPSDRLFVTPWDVLGHARVTHPSESRRIARTEPQGLGNMRLGLFHVPNKKLAISDEGMGVGEISI